jgi:endogenous inhibitor of DNA gyrase (YacG/DUF329 family)
MPRVTVTCPKTGKQVYTGVNLNWDTFDSYEFKQQTFDCPECGKWHTWSRADATLDETGGG